MSASPSGSQTFFLPPVLSRAAFNSEYVAQALVFYLNLLKSLYRLFYYNYSLRPSFFFASTMQASRADIPTAYATMAWADALHILVMQQLSEDEQSLLEDYWQLVVSIRRSRLKAYS